MKILVINAGSSSLKYQVFDMDHETVLCKGGCERIGIPDSFMTHKHADGRRKEYQQDMEDHGDAIRLVFRALTDPEIGVVKHMDEIGAVGHRVLHGGEKFTASTIVNEAVKEGIREVIPLGPLHNPANLKGIEACEQAMPGVPQVAVFDTAFHQTMPAYAYMYGLPYEYYEKYRVRRYGAHGTSHQFVAGVGAKLAGLDINNSKIITCHLGAGSSICAIQNGKCVDTSMGFSPLEGMIMGTRVGNIDANAVIYLENKLGVTPDEMSVILNRKSGFLGLSTKSSDARELDEFANNGDPKAKLVFKKFTYDIIKNIGSYVAAMNGVDLIVFTGGIGEHNSRLRRRVLENFSYLGLKVDYEANVAFAEDAIITTEDSKVKAALICTNEELVIARDTMHLVLENQE